MILTAAERARTILATSGDVQVSLLGTTSDLARHVVTPDGSLLLLAPARASGLFGVASRSSADLVTVEATDVVSVPQPDRVRGRLRLLGSLDTRGGPWSGDVVDHLRGPEPEPVGPVEPVEVVRFVPTGVSLDWPRQERWVGVDLDSYRVADHDPLADLEHTWLPHLEQGHAALLRALAARACPGLAPSVSVHALGLDRFGLTLRLYAPGRSTDVRLPFADGPVRCGCGVRTALDALLRTTTSAR